MKTDTKQDVIRPHTPFLLFFNPQLFPARLEMFGFCSENGATMEAPKRAGQQKQKLYTFQWPQACTWEQSFCADAFAAVESVCYFPCLLLVFFKHRQQQQIKKKSSQFSNFNGTVSSSSGILVFTQVVAFLHSSRRSSRGTAVSTYILYGLGLRPAPTRPEAQASIETSLSAERNCLPTACLRQGWGKCGDNLEALW